MHTQARDDTRVVRAVVVALAHAVRLGAVAGDVRVGGAQEAEGQDEGADLETHVGRRAGKCTSSEWMSSIWDGLEEEKEDDEQEEGGRGEAGRSPSPLFMLFPLSWPRLSAIQLDELILY